MSIQDHKALFFYYFKIGISIDNDIDIDTDIDIAIEVIRVFVRINPVVDNTNPFVFPITIASKLFELPTALVMTTPKSETKLEANDLHAITQIIFGGNVGIHMSNCSLRTDNNAKPETTGCIVCNIDLKIGFLVNIVACLDNPGEIKFETRFKSAVRAIYYDRCSYTGITATNLEQYPKKLKRLVKQLAKTSIVSILA